MEPVVILAGGKSRRMGKDKLSLSFGGSTLLKSAVTRFKTYFEDVYISVSDATRYPEAEASRVVDIIPGAGPLSGLHASLSQISGCAGVFLSAADLPFSEPRTALRIIELCENCDLSIIKLPDGRLEPLFGYYKKTLLPQCEALLKSGNFRMSGLISAANTRYISTQELSELWDDKMLLNVNYPEDYEKII